MSHEPEEDKENESPEALEKRWQALKKAQAEGRQLMGALEKGDTVAPTSQSATSSAKVNPPQPQEVVDSTTPPVVRQIDLTKLDEEEKRLILKLVKVDDPNSLVWLWSKDREHTVVGDDGKAVTFKLSHDLLRRGRKESKVGYRHEVLEANILGQGQQSIIRAVVGTLRPQEDESLLEFSQKKSRVVKFAKDVRGTSFEGRRQIMREEAERIQETGAIKIKPVDIDAMVMERLTGETLDKMLGKLTPQEQDEVVLGLLESLKTITEAGVIHLDIKPENIMVDRSVRPVKVRIFDFGVSVKIAEDKPEQYVRVLTTPAYRPPEFKGIAVLEKDVTPAADVYSVAVVIGQVLSGKQMEGRSNMRAFIEDTIMSNVSDENRRQILQRAMDPDRTERSTVDVLLNQFRGLKPSLDQTQKSEKEKTSSVIVEVDAAQTYVKTGDSRQDNVAISNADKAFQLIKDVWTFIKNTASSVFNKFMRGSVDASEPLENKTQSGVDAAMTKKVDAETQRIFEAVMNPGKFKNLDEVFGVSPEARVEESKAPEVEVTPPSVVSQPEVVTAGTTIDAPPPVDNRIPMIDIDQYVPQSSTVPPMAREAFKVTVTTVETTIPFDQIREALAQVLTAHNKTREGSKAKMSFAQTENLLRASILGIEISKRADGPIVITTTATSEGGKVVVDILTNLPEKGRAKEVTVEGGRNDIVVDALQSSDPSHTVNPPQENWGMKSK